MLKYLKKYWFWCILAPIFMLGEISMDLIQPDLMAQIVDNGVLRGDMALVVKIGVKMIVLVFVGGSCGILSGVFANFAAQRFGNDLRKAVFEKIMRLSFQQADEISTGSLITRLTNDVTQVQTMVMMSVRSIVRCGIMFLGGIFMLYRQSAEFAAIAVCALPFVAMFVVFFMKKASPMFAVVQRKLDRINCIMQENIAGARVVKAFVREKRELENFDEANNELSGINLRVQSCLAFMNPCMNIVLNLCVVLIIAFGGYSVNNGSGVTPGEIMAAITYMSMILHGMMFMANIFQTFTRAAASRARICEVLDCDIAVCDGSGSEADERRRGELEFRGVGFAYPKSSGRRVLDNISFKAEKGETVAVIGATGSGKSSLVNLIPRFYDVDEGEILVSGANVKDYSLKKLREKIAIVLQRTELYSRTIEANIRWGKDEADPWEIKRAAEIAQADDFVCGTAYGYYTQVSEGGRSLSGGQKQRISISRAVLRDADIVIFDDSTSALDLKTEAEFYKALDEECPNVTKLIIAQRIASVRDADKIIVLDGGKISACGTHEELLKNSELYRDIYSLQQKDGELAK